MKCAWLWFPSWLRMESEVEAPPVSWSMTGMAKVLSNVSETHGPHLREAACPKETSLGLSSGTHTMSQ